MGHESIRYFNFLEKCPETLYWVMQKFLEGAYNQGNGTKLGTTSRSKRLCNFFTFLGDLLCLNNWQDLVVNGHAFDG